MKKASKIILWAIAVFGVFLLVNPPKVIWSGGARRPIRITVRSVEGRLIPGAVVVLDRGRHQTLREKMGDEKFTKYLVESRTGFVSDKKGSGVLHGQFGGGGETGLFGGTGQFWVSGNLIATHPDYIDVSVPLANFAGARRFSLRKKDFEFTVFMNPKTAESAPADVSLPDSPESTSSGFGQEMKLQVADSGSPEVDQLVLQLVSLRPAPLPVTGVEVPQEFSMDVLLGKFPNSRYQTKEVTAAVRKLTELGPKVFPYLIKHLHDDRYCFSTRLPSASPDGGWINCSVGEAVHDILSDGFEPSFYKIRDGKSGKSLCPPNFWEYVESAGGEETWAAKAAKQTRSQTEVEIIDWCIKIERERGFVDDAEEKELMDRYLQRREQALQRK